MIWADMGRYGEIWADMGRYGEMSYPRGMGVEMIFSHLDRSVETVIRQSSRAIRSWSVSPGRRCAHPRVMAFKHRYGVTV